MFIWYNAIGNISYKYLIDLFHQTFHNIYDPLEDLRKLLKKFTESVLAMDIYKTQETCNENDEMIY